MKKISVLVSIILVLAFIMTGCASKTTTTTGNSSKPAAAADKPVEVRTLKFVQSNNDKHKYHFAMVKAKELIEQKSNGRYKVQIFDGTLGGDSDLIQGLQMGTMDAAAVNTAVVASIVPEIGVFDLPFLFKDSAQAFRVFDGDIGKGLKGKVNEKAGIVALSFWENGFRDFTNDERPIKKPEDLKGLKMRVMQNNVMIETFKAWGANPTPMSWPDVYPAMQQGVIDGHDNAADTVNANKLWEVQKYFTESRHFYSAVLFGFSPKTWNSFSDEDKKFFTEISAEVATFERDLAAKMYGEGMVNLRTKMTVTEYSDIDFEAFKASVKPIWEKYSETYGKDLIDKIANS